jgi:hypothetical protein
VRRVRLFRILLFSAGLWAAEHERAWQTGTILDYDRSKTYAGTDANGSASYYIHEMEAIDAGDRIYYIRRRIKWRWSKYAELTVNAPVKFAIEGKAIYLIDEDGKEYKTWIVKKVLKTK